ncbi:MAG: NADH-quinone oxidoreductase subunit N [Phycisphaerales bacterium]|nr:NADH-quinone oxidoreductase subunit N [Phycisphaerales bacterium]
MIEKLQTLWPEITLFIAACAVMIVGLSGTRSIRALCTPICGLALLIATFLSLGGLGGVDITVTGPLPVLASYGKAMVGVIGVILLLLIPGVVDREFDAAPGGPGEAPQPPRAFEAIRSNTAEFHAFFLFSLMGLMLCAGADDLIWLFLALELTSLPTYVMVTISTARNRSLEAGVKYFFLGALGAAIFLYGFALIYGGTGSTNLEAVHASIVAQADAGGINSITMAGFVMAIIGLCFKIAAVPMHFYTPDVYQGAAAPVAAFLAFVPKSAGFFAIMLLTATLGWSFGASGTELPGPVHSALYIIAVLTMTVGNVLAILQNSIKRILAYSSIAHSGYMLVGIIAGPGGGGGADSTLSRNGLSAVWFYLVCYGVMNVGAFAVVASLERRRADGTHDEIDSVADLRGLCASRPLLGWTMVISAAGLLGLPPLLGFFGKLPLFTSGVGAGHYLLVIILGINSAIAAYYYLRLAAAPLLESRDPAESVGGEIVESPYRLRTAAGLISAVGVVALALGLGGPLGSAATSVGQSGFAPSYVGRRAADRSPAVIPAAAHTVDDEPRDVEPAADGSVDGATIESDGGPPDARFDHAR